MKPINVGTLSISGHFLKRVLPALRKSKIVHAYAIASRDPVKAERFARELHIPQHYGSYDSLIYDEAVDIVYLPLPNHLHAEWIRRCADAGKHVICEKPIALNAHEAEEALEYAKQKKICVMEGFMYKFHPQWARVKELIDAGEIGRLKLIEVFFGYMNENPDDIRNQKDAGGGALYDIGCYAVSVARFLTESEPKRVMCSQVIDPVFFTDAVTNGILDFGDVCATFTVSTKIYQHQRVDIHGEKGMITVDMPFNAHPDTSERLIIKAEDEETIELCGPADQYMIQFESFAQHMAACCPPLIPPSDAIANMHVIDMLFRSAENERWEKV